MTKYQKKLKAKNITVSVLRYVFLIAFSYVLIYPVIYMLSNALRGTVDYIDPSVVWIPKIITFKNFSDAYKALDYPTAIKNTVILEMVSAVIEVFTCSIYAYGMSRFKLKIKGLLIAMLFITILLPDVMLILPRILNFRQLDFLGILGMIGKVIGKDIRPDIYGTPLTFYLPSIFGVGLKAGIFIFIYMQFFSGLPNELEEAAWIDGAGPVRTYLQIVMPSSGVVFLTVFIFSFIWHWNDYYLAMMYSMENKTLAVLVRTIQDQVFLTFGEANGANSLIFGVPPAACILFILPPLIIYALLQKQFIKSIDRVGIVG